MPATGGTGDGVAVADTDGIGDGVGDTTGGLEAAGAVGPAGAVPLRSARLTPSAPPTTRTTIAAANTAPTRGPTRKPKRPAPVRLPASVTAASPRSSAAAPGTRGSTAR